MKRQLLFGVSVAVAAGALVACDTEEVACTATGGECGNYACVLAEGATEGTCSATCTEGCAAGYVCSSEVGSTECVEGGGSACDGSDECGAYTCDLSTGSCRTSCSSATDCIEAAQCDDGEGSGGTCVEVADLPYKYVAVVSTATGADALNNPNPGPDVDGVSVTVAGAETFASNVVDSEAGPIGDEANTRDNFSAITGALDALGATPADCNLESEPGYVALGGAGGFAVVSFGSTEFNTNDVITVYEINSANCTAAATERPDTYEVYVTNDADAAMAASATAIRTTWCLVGAQPGTGGTGTFTFDASDCN